MAADGVTYERTNITAWLNKHNTSPTTGNILANKVLIQNSNIKQAINEYLELNK